MVRPPFPYYGAKARIAPMVWTLLGDPSVYIEPFAGSIGVLLGRPGGARPQHYEVIGDADHFVANFWRAVTAEPAAVAAAADHPMVEADLAAIGRWLLVTGRERLAKLNEDIDAYDAEVAGRWAWCHSTAVGVNVWQRMTSGYKGVNKLTRDLPADLALLADRLRNVQVFLGDWERTTRAPRWRDGTFGVFLDPPYRQIDRKKDLYAVEADMDGELHDRIEAWCLSAPPDWRIAVAGYDGDFTLPGWRVLSPDLATAPPGRGRSVANQQRERLWTNMEPPSGVLF